MCFIFHFVPQHPGNYNKKFPQLANLNTFYELKSNTEAATKNTKTAKINFFN